jgi:hypothetical protein
MNTNEHNKLQHVKNLFSPILYIYIVYNLPLGSQIIYLIYNPFKIFNMTKLILYIEINFNGKRLWYIINNFL